MDPVLVGTVACILFLWSCGCFYAGYMVGHTRGEYEIAHEIFDSTTNPRDE